MATKEQIEKWLLEHCTVATAQGCVEGTGLIKLHQKIFGHGKNVIKADAARDLAAFYADGQNIIDIWNGSADGLIPTEGLNETERAFVSVIAQYNGREFKPTSKKLAAEFGLTYEQEKRGYYYSSRDPFDEDYNYGSFYLAFLHLLKQTYPNTRTTLLFPGGKEMPFFVLEPLRRVIPPFAYVYSPFKPGEKDLVICREERIGDFAAVVRFAGSEALKVKQYSFDITKAKLTKMTETIGFPEVCDNAGKFGTPKDAARNNDFKVAAPMFALAADIGLLDIDKTLAVKPSKNAIRLLAEPPHIFAQKLFERYLSKNDIYETHYVTYISVRDGESWLDWAACRRPIVDLLKTCPAGEWVSFSDFERYVLIFHGDFFRKILNCAVFVQGYKHYRSNYTPDWDECEAQILRVILSFLGAIGVLDIAYTEHTPRFKSDFYDRYDYGDEDDSDNADGKDCCVGISGFRITKLGAWILGLTDTYDAPASHVLQEGDGGLVVQPDYTVVISGMTSRVEHEPYLSGFLTKQSVDENVSVYKIDFSSIVRAYNQGIMPKEIERYLQKASSRPLTDNILRAFDGWQAKLGRVRIRTLTLLETDDTLLLEELIHTKGIEKFLGEKIENAVIIADGKDSMSVKTAAEKNGWLVEMKGSVGRGKCGRKK